jgi:hypothetical protein
MEKEQVEHRNKLEEIAERVDEDRNARDSGLTLDEVAQDRLDLMDIVFAAHAQVDDFRTYARNIRHNNYDYRQDWEERAKTYERSAADLSGALERAVAKL